jgi:hypothetical protein
VLFNTVERVGIRPELQSIFLKGRQLEELLRVWNGSWPFLGSGFSILNATATNMILALMDLRLELTARYGAVTQDEPTNSNVMIDWENEVLRRQMGTFAKSTDLQDAAGLLKQLHPLAQELADEIELYVKNDAKKQPLPSKFETVSGLCRELGTIDEAIRRHSDEVESRRLDDQRRKLQQELEAVRTRVAELAKFAESVGAKEKDVLAAALACLSSDAEKMQISGHSR